MLTQEEFPRKVWTFRWKNNAIIAKNIRLLDDLTISPSPSNNETYWGIVDRRLCFFDRDHYCTVRFNEVNRRDDGTYIMAGRYTLVQTKVQVVELAEACEPIEVILARFESLGDNCEFGIVQRYYGVEPLGLFRFNYTYMTFLLNGLDENFSHLEEPDFFKLEKAGTAYMGVVDKYRMRFHIYATEGTTEADIMNNEITKLRFLRRKFLQGLQEGQRVFVRKGEKSTSVEDIMPLYRRLRAFGDNHLLWVTPSSDEKSEGTVEMLADGLYHGYIRNFAKYENATRIAADTWATLLRNAYDTIF